MNAKLWNWTFVNHYLLYNNLTTKYTLVCAIGLESNEILASPNEIPQWGKKFLFEFQSLSRIQIRVSQRVSRANSKKCDIILPSTPHIMFSSEWKVLWQKWVKLQPVLLDCGEFLAVTFCNVFFSDQCDLCAMFWFSLKLA